MHFVCVITHFSSISLNSESERRISSLVALNISRRTMIFSKPPGIKEVLGIYKYSGVKFFKLKYRILQNNPKPGKIHASLYSTASQISHMYIFDRNAKKLQKERSARNPDVALYDYLKEEIGFRLADRVFDIKRNIKRAADIGCNRGFISKHIMAESVEHLTLCDTSPTMLEQAQGTPGLRIEKLELDEEHLNFDENSLDLVISSLSLHWVNDLPGCFSKVLKSLKPDGVFIASLFGGDTLYELRSSLQLAELERKGGIAPHISPFTQIRDIGALLNRAGFTMLTIDTDEVAVGYPSMYELMWDLKGMAENNAAFNRPAHISRDTLIAASAIYKELYGKKEGITATFQIIYLVGWKPAPSQPKPLERGTGEVPLKDLGKIIAGGGGTKCVKK